MIFELLHVGRENPTTARELSQITGLSMRDIRKQIENERRAGAPICAENNAHPGYYLASDAGEMIEYCERLKHHETEITRTRYACLLTVNTLPERKQRARI